MFPLNKMCLPPNVDCCQYTLDDINDMQQSILDEYRNSFVTPSPHCFVIYYLTGYEYVPQIIDDISMDLEMFSLGLLDICLESESQYPGTFWIECFRVFSYNKLDVKVGEPITRIFYAFLHTMVKFNNSHRNILPEIWHSTVELRRACNFYEKRTDLLDILSLKVARTSFTIQYDSSSLNPENENENEEEEYDDVGFDGVFSLTENYIRSLLV